MGRRRTKISENDDGETVITPDLGEHAFAVEDAQKLEAALSDCDDRADEASEMRAAVLDTIKAKGFTKDIFQAAHKLKRKKDLLAAQAWIRQFLLYCQAIGIWDQGDLFDKPVPNVPQPTPTLN